MACTICTSINSLDKLPSFWSVPPDPFEIPWMQMKYATPSNLAFWTQHWNFHPNSFRSKVGPTPNGHFSQNLSNISKWVRELRDPNQGFPCLKLTFSSIKTSRTDIWGCLPEVQVQYPLLNTEGWKIGN